MDKLQFTELDKIDAIVKAAVSDAIDKHKKLGQSISIWKDERVVTLTPEQIRLDLPSAKPNNFKTD